MTSISSNGKVAYIYDQASQTWFPIAGTTNTAANYDWTGVHEFSSNPVTFNEVLYAQGGVNNFQNPNARDAAIPSAPDGLVCFIRQTNAGEQINQLQYYYSGVWKNLVGYSQISNKLTNYTITAGDAGKIITVDSSSSNVITIPANSSETIVAGYKIEIVQLGSGTTSIQPAIGVSLKSKGRESLPATVPESPLEFDSRYSKITLLKIDTNTWLAYGDIIESSSSVPYSFTPTSYSFTPAYSFTPTTPYTFTPVAYTFVPATPYSFTPAYTFTPVAYTFVPVAYTFTPATSYTFTPVAYTFTPVAYSFTPISTTVSVPDVVGYTSNLAQALIVDAGLVNAPTIGTTSAGATPENDGKVKTQNPVAGTVVPLGSDVSITVYNYIATYTFTPTTSYTFTPVAYTFTPTAYSFTPNSLCSDFSLLDESECQTCGGNWNATYNECWDPNESTYSFTPVAYSFTPVAYSFTPMTYTFTPVAYTFTPVAYTFTPNSNCADLSLISNPQTCTSCGGNWNATYNECSDPNAPAYSFTPVAYTFTPYSFTPVAYTFTPVAYTFTPVAYTFTPYSFTPVAYTFTPVAYTFTPVAYTFTPATPYSFTPNSLCSDFSILNQSQCQACGGTYDPVFGECTPP